MTTVSIHMPENTGLTGFTLFLRKTSDGTLVNAGGDALTESPASSGRFTATVAESWAETLAAVVLDSNSLAVRDGWLASGETLVKDGYPASGGGGGSSAADIWAYATRTLTSTLTITNDDIDAIVAGVTAAGPGLYNVIRNDDLTLRIGDEFEQAITGLGNISSRDDLVFTLKAAESDADTAAKIYLSENNGLTRLNGAAYATTANGTITVDDEVNGDITIRISSAATASLTKATRVDAVKVLQSGGNDRTPRVGRTQVLPVVVEARG